ncbi:MAG TPA: hypothetical protein VGD98_14605 [Ktedonobacteraceae bacterium]
MRQVTVVTGNGMLHNPGFLVIFTLLVFVFFLGWYRLSKEEVKAECQPFEQFLFVEKALKQTEPADQEGFALSSILRAANYLSMAGSVYDTENTGEQPLFNTYRGDWCLLNRGDGDYL